MPSRTPMKADESDFERGYHGHGRGVVVTQPEPGVFHERPMTAGELAARAPAWVIGADPYEFLNRAAFAYIKAWEAIATAIDAALAAQLAQHDKRVSELLTVNNREVERRRARDDVLRTILTRIEDTVAADWKITENYSLADLIRDALRA